MARLQNITGIERVEAVFRGMPRDMTAKITDALNRGAEEVETRAKQIVPEDTGELEGAIEIRSDLNGFTARGAVGRMVAGGGDTAVRRFIGVFPQSRGSRGWYAAFVEFGTAPRVAGQTYTQASGRRRKAGNTHKGTPAQPFLFPAYWSLRKRVQGRIKRAINAAVKDTVRRGR